MTVSEAINQLSKLPPFLEVFVDKTPSHSDVWVMAPLETIDEVCTEDNSANVVLLTNVNLDEAPRQPETFKEN